LRSNHYFQHFGCFSPFKTRAQSWDLFLEGRGITARWSYADCKIRLSGENFIQLVMFAHSLSPQALIWAPQRTGFPTS